MLICFAPLLSAISDGNSTDSAIAQEMFYFQRCPLLAFAPYGRGPGGLSFHYSGPELFVGYGMADQEREANLPQVYVVGGPE